jgi:F-type H+-transporting ATPase subunit gamma
MARIREIKKRIGAVRTIQRITKTMQMIATAKFTTAVQRAQASKPYTQKIQGLVGEVLAATQDFEHPLIDGPADSPRRERLLVIASNRGLCGAYNANVLRTGMKHVRELRAGGLELDLETVGKKAVAFFRFQRVEVSQRHTIPDQPPYDLVERLAEEYLEDFLAGKHDAVRVASMHFESNARQVPKVIQLLPLEPAAVSAEATTGPRATYEFSPSAEAILGRLLPLAVKTVLFQAFLEAAVSEHIMRMVAMKAATENAGDLRKLLIRNYNRARQTQITTELMEIIGGAAALA